MAAIENLVPVKRALISTFNGWGLEDFVSDLLKTCPDIHILSTGKTLKKLSQILGSVAENHLQSVEEYIGHIAVQPGVPRTLDWRIITGILFEEETHADLAKQFGILPIDLVVCNVNLFGASAAQVGLNIEKIRHLIEIERPNLIRAAIRGLHRCTVLTSPEDYGEFLKRIHEKDGKTDVIDRAQFAAKAMRMIAHLDTDVAQFMKNLMMNDPAVVYEAYKKTAPIIKEELDLVQEEKPSVEDNLTQEFLKSLNESKLKTVEGETSLDGLNADELVDPDTV